MRIDSSNEVRVGRGPSLWTAAVLLTSAPLVAILCLTLWQTPFPISEAVAIFEDIARQPATDFFVPDTSYYRPLYHLTISTIWYNAGSLEARLAWVKVLQIVPVILLVMLLVWHLRPRTFFDAALAAAAVAILVGSPGFRDNLEIPLSYTTVGMPLALGVWILMSRQPRWWHQPAIIVLTLVAIGFKEQGLILVPLVVAAWWTRAPGASRTTAVTVVVIAVAYAALRLSWRGSWPMFEQAVGLGFGEMEPPEAEARFGAFPYFIFAYSSASTVANVLFSEPTRGTFSIVRAIASGHPQPWQLLYLGSAVLLSAVIAWWGINALRSATRGGWSPEARVFVALLVTLLACGALSFNYSRDRLGGMAVPFYAVAAFHALRAAATPVVRAPRGRFVLVGLTLMWLVTAWHIRAIGTVERARLTAQRNQTEWLVLLPSRRAEFADRATYLQIMEAMIQQGTYPEAPHPTRYPRWMTRVLGRAMTASHVLQEPARRLRHLAILLAIPSVVVALGLCGIEAWRALRPRSPLFAAPVAYSLTDAIAGGDLWQAYQFIRAGQDPNGLIPVQHAVLTRGRWVFVSPVIWATATQNTQAVQMLLAFGARLDGPADRQAVCLAGALGNEDIVRLLQAREDGQPTRPCTLEAGEALLLRLLDSVE